MNKVNKVSIVHRIALSTTRKLNLHLLIRQELYKLIKSKELIATSKAKNNYKMKKKATRMIELTFIN